MSTQAMAPAASPAPTNEARLGDAVKSAKDAKDKGQGAPTGCLPKFSSPRILSPGYFSRMTPRTRASLGDENFSAQLLEMREKFPGHPDHDMVPFLRIHNGNLSEAETLYESCLAWRAANLPVDRASCIKSLSKGMFYFHGMDLEGRPVGYLTMRGHDPKTRDLNECMRSMVYVCEKLIASLPAKEVQVTVVLDRIGTTMKNQDSDMMKQFFALFSEKYPNKLAKVLVCPANMVFRTLWSAIKFTMPERVRGKVIMCNSEKELLAHIAPEQLLTSLGGKDTFTFDPEAL